MCSRLVAIAGSRALIWVAELITSLPRNKAIGQHCYPGNIREVENVIEYAFAICPGGLIDEYHLPPELRAVPVGETSAGIGHMTFGEMEVMHITETLRRCAGNREAAAKSLGIHRATLFCKIKALGIQVPEVSS